MYIMLLSRLELFLQKMNKENQLILINHETIFSGTLVTNPKMV